jgi:hypothetical protein
MMPILARKPTAAKHNNKAGVQFPSLATTAPSLSGALDFYNEWTTKTVPPGEATQGKKLYLLRVFPCLCLRVQFPKK